MLLLQAHHIIDLYVLIDDTVPMVPKPFGGRPSILSNSELITILVWNTLTVQQQTLKALHTWLRIYHQKDFPRLPSYPTFVEHCHRILPLLMQLIRMFLTTTAPLRFMDSTMLQVCKLVRANTHKVAKRIADFGKNHQGWHFGFKLHASIDTRGRFCGLALTPASCHDAQQIPFLVNQYTKVAVGDGGYTASVMRDLIWKRFGTLIISPVHPKQKRKVAAAWQLFLLRLRPKIESVFDYLKEHLHLVSSFPRSPKGYLLHYLRILLGYQLMSL